MHPCPTPGALWIKHPTGDDLHGIEIELEIVKGSTATFQWSKWSMFLP